MTIEVEVSIADHARAALQAAGFDAVSGDRGWPRGLSGTSTTDPASTPRGAVFHAA
jgi:hypothetical protein